MRTKLVSQIQKRLAEEVTNRSSLAYLKDLEVEDYIDQVISVIYLYTRSKRKGPRRHTILMVEVIAAIGHGIRNKYKLKRNSSIAAKTGAFILYTFEELQMLQVVLGQGAKGHATYIVQVLDDDAICSLWNNLSPHTIEKLPSETPYEDWTSTRHETGVYLVKTGNKAVLEMISPEKQPIIFDCVNKAQHVGWRINKFVYELHLWALRNKATAFRDIWDTVSPEARATKMRETKAIGEIAKKFLEKTFYHLYYYDFRGRKYPATAYLHEQGSDISKGLLLMNDKKEIGEDGYFWLLVTIASTWAGDSGREDKAKTDKIPLKERAEWTLDNEEIILSYAKDPKVNQGWMEADKPWQFIAACHELLELRTWQYENQNVNYVRYPGVSPWEVYDYESSLVSYIDGSNNGSQHLSALTKDEITAPHVNLVPLPMPGDLYKYVSDDVWKRLDDVVSHYTKDEKLTCDRLIDNLIEYKKEIGAAEPKSDKRKALVTKIQQFKEKNKEMIMKAAPVYWARVTDEKERRKIVKRNVMTLPYGGTAYGLGEQQIDDAKKHGIELLLHMEHRWGAYLGREIYNACRESLKRPMQLLSVFEMAGKKAEQEGKFLQWTVPVTNFPVVQNYTEGKVKKIWVQYGPPLGEKMSTGYYVNTLQLAICFIEDVKPSKGKQSQGASPNAIHSLDAAHLAMTVAEADFPLATVHDSFGALLGDMPKLFTLIRKTFVELYEADPLTSIMKDVAGDVSQIEFGNLDINLILESEYCFS